MTKLGKTGKVLDKVGDVGGIFNKVPDGNAANHIFSSKPGKFVDTPENRKILEDLSNNSNNYLGKDQYGKEWYAQTLEDGTQVYSYTQDGIIKGGGINDEPINITEIYNLTK